jgi:secondary thiamine-phosphate synthase enzyme
MELEISTKGHNDVIDITAKVEEAVQISGIQEGVVLIFVSHSTAAITTLEYEKGVIKDLDALLEKYIPEDFDYEHHKRWGDRNGAAHLKAAIIDPDLMVGVKNNKLLLGTWQQIVLIDFDERGRNRTVHVVAK